VTSERFQRPQTAAGAHHVSATDLPPHPPDVRDEEVAEVLAAEFPVALRGYDRTAVDAYVQRVSRILAELQAGRSPQSAVRYALEQVSEETRAILQQAHDSADQITSKSRSQAAERMETAERESSQMLEDARRDAAEMRADAERDAADMRASAERDAAELRTAADRRVREAEDDVASIWQERQRLIEDAREIAGRLAEVADAAAEREPPAAIEATEGDTSSLPAAPVWDADPDGDGTPPPPAAGRPSWDVDDEEDEDSAPPWGDDLDSSLQDAPPPDPASGVNQSPPPPPPPDAAPDPELADAPPPPSETPGPLAFELHDDSELGPMDEPAAPRAVDEAAVPDGGTQEWTPPFVHGHQPAEDDDDTLERPR
jgi:DivIVA domain-containing protein